MSGSGLIVATKIKNEIKFVLLKGKFKDEGKLDFPKGTVDEGESIEEAAYREAFEEANIQKGITTEVHNEWYTPLNSRHLYLKLVIIDQEELKNIKIKKNPHTGIVEHNGYTLLSAKEGEKDLLYYLKGSLYWAENIIEAYFRRKDERN
jgi:8-oxo-dGTP pyrophosphatase MutT (NUDIX family)